MAYVVAALVIDAWLGDPACLCHPVVVIGRSIGWLEKQVRKLRLSPRGLRWTGLLLWCCTVLPAYGITWGALWLAKGIHPLLFGVLNLYFLWTCLALCTLKKEVGKVAKALLTGDIPNARCKIAYLVSRDTAEMDEREIARAALETAAENTSDGVLAPLFFMMLGGAPLAMAYKAVNTLDSMVGYKNEAYADFGFASAKLDDVANWVPARLTGWLMLLWAALTGRNATRGYHIMKRDHGKAASPNAGYPEAAAAGILGVRLGGSAYYFGKRVQKPLMGAEFPPPAPKDIVDCFSLMNGSTLLLALAGILFEIGGRLLW